MSQILSMGSNIDTTGIADGTLADWDDTITVAKITVDGVKQIQVSHYDIVAQIAGASYTIPAATQSVNTADVVTPTTYYCYYELVDGVPTWVASTTHPDLIIPEPEDYVWIRAIRFRSIADVATIEFVQQQIMSSKESLHQIADYGYLLPPVYISGFAPTFSLTTGEISTEEGLYRRITGEIRTRAAISAGVYYNPQNDVSRANLALGTLYAGGETITDGSYVKLLVGVLVNATSDYGYIVNVQAKPATEYGTAAEAWADAERKASSGFSSIRRSSILPLAWVVIKKGDASTITWADIRETGLVTMSNGTSGITSHSALSNLNVVSDHQDYLLMDGTRALTGNLLVDAGHTIDGVDISAHAADTEAHHATVTLGATATPILGLSTQELGFDVQATKKVLAGPASGGDAAPTFRQLAAADISDFDAAALLAAPAVSLAVSATGLMDVTGQEISLDTQVTKTVLAGPVSGAAAAPTFRQLAAADISDFNAAALLAAPAVSLSASATGLMDLTGQAISLDTQAQYAVLSGPTAATPASPTFKVPTAAFISDFATAALTAAPAVTIGTSAAELLDITGQELTLDLQENKTILAGPTTGDPAAPTFRILISTDINGFATDALAAAPAVTLGATAAVLLGVTGQELSLDTQVTKTVLAGPASGSDAAPTFRQLVSGDITNFATDALAAAPAVTLGASAAVLLDITGQALTLDTQVTKTVLAGPVSGVDAEPTFRQLVSGDITNFATDALAAAPAVTLAASADVLLGVTGQALSLDTQAQHTMLCGPSAATPAAPTFRVPVAADISDFDAAALAAAPAVTLTVNADSILGLTDQLLSFDTETASTVLAGPIVGGAAAAPTFRQLNIQDIATPSGVLTLATGANNNVALTAGTRVYAVAGPTGAFSITGFTGGVDGAVIYIYNPLSQNMSLTNESSSSTAANRIAVGSGTATSNAGAVTLFYIAGTVNRWIASALIA